ncbi:MAG: hypothetical protein BGO69_11705 [Bacteroidetes bacterium 46-16]|nr:MAG: hypothetical protein BGO69_11705 [Bacteroidetes bacterium 46-16]
MYPRKFGQEQQARELFLTSEKTRSEIAAEVGVSEKTISNWSVRGRWQELKRAAVQAPAVIAQQMYEELEEINNVIRSRPEGQRLPTAAEAELRRKIITSIRHIKRQLSTPELYQSLRAFVNYVLSRDKRHIGLDFFIEEFIAGERSAPKQALKPSDMEFEHQETPGPPASIEEFLDNLPENPEFDMRAFWKETAREENERYIEEFKKENDGMLPYTEGCDELAVFRHNTRIILEQSKKLEKEKQNQQDPGVSSGNLQEPSGKSGEA